MGCLTNYSCPITIPTGLTGAAGAAGADGIDGAAILENTIQATSSYTGVADTVLNTYTLTGGTLSIDDVLEIESYITLTTTFRGSVYITFGGSTVCIYNLTSSGTDTALPPTSGGPNLILKVRVFMKTTGTESAFPSVEILGNPTSTIKPYYSGISVNTAVNTVINVKTTPTAGTATSHYLLVTHLKKV